MENLTENLTNQCFNLFLAMPIYILMQSKLQSAEHLLEKSVNLTAAEHTTACLTLILLCLVKSATTASKTKRLLGIASFRSIYIHILLLKNMEGSQRSQFKDNFQVNVG